MIFFFPNPWAAEEFVGKLRRLRRIKAYVPLEARDQGLTAKDLYETPLAYCAICGTGLLTYWEALISDGTLIPVGSECIRIALGGLPPGQIARDLERAARLEDRERVAALEAKQLQFAWRAQRDLRAILLAGARAERREGLGFWWQRALKAARAGRMSSKWESYIRKFANNAGQAEAAAVRSAKAMYDLDRLTKCNLGMYDQGIVWDLNNRLWAATDPTSVPGSPISDKQAALINKFVHKYRKQLR